MFPADTLSAVAISGVAGIAIELIRLFQTELEHYEKLEGSRLSLEGKANHLAAMVRAQLPMAFQGLVVVPLFCGFDEVAGRGRLYSYDVVGGRYEETDFTATGSGGPYAKAHLRGAFREGLTEDEALGVAVEALVAAAEEDSATGGPDLAEGHLPQRRGDLGAGVPRAGRGAGGRCRPAGDGGGAMTVPFYVPPEQLMKDRAEYARKGIARGKSIAAVEYADGILLVAENPSGTLHKIGEIYDRIAFAGAGKYSEFETLRVAGIRHADLKGYSYARTDVTAKSLANAYSHALGQIFTQEVKPYEVGIMLAEVGDTTAGNLLFKITYDGTLSAEDHVAVIGGQEEQLAAPAAPELPARRAAGRGGAVGGGRLPDGGGPHLRASPSGRRRWSTGLWAGRAFRRLAASEMAAPRAAAEQAPGEQHQQAGGDRRPPPGPCRAVPIGEHRRDAGVGPGPAPGSPASSTIARASSSSRLRHPDLGGRHARRP